MSDSSQGPGWWLASDGRWYPPESHPNSVPPPAPPAPPKPAAPQGFQPLKSSVRQWSQGAMWVVTIAQGILTLVAYRYWQAYDSWYNGSGSLTAAVSSENLYNSFTAITALLWVAGFVTLVVWLANVHTTTTSLLPGSQERKYTRGWSIGVWFIPIVNLFSTPQVIAENQKIAYAKREYGLVDESWRSNPVKSGLVGWWLLVAVGMIISQYAGSMMSSAQTNDTDYLNAIMGVIVGGVLTTTGLAVGTLFLTDMNKQLATSTPGMITKWPI